MKNTALATLVALLVAEPAAANLTSLDPKDPRPVPVIDIHTHVFNASDVPVGGLISSLLPERVAQAAEAALARNVEPEDAAPVAPPQAKFFHIAPMRVLPKEESLKFRLLPEERSAFADFLGLEKTTWSRDFSQQSAFEGRILPRDVVTTDMPTDLDRLAQVLQKAEFLMEPEHAVNQLVQANGEKSAGLFGYVRFIHLMLQSRTAITNALVSDYPPGDLFVAHMMDMDRAYASHSRTPFERQQGIMQDLTRAFHGRLVHFTAFDPFRDANALASVNAGLADGALGVKVYPPSGYRPARNQFPPRPNVPEAAVRRWDARYATRTEAGLDATMEAFFADMEKRGIPVFTHCTSEGFQAVAGYGLNADPQYWEDVLQRHPRLRVCFGHAGGHQFWFSAPGAPDNEPPPAGSADFQQAWSFGRKVVDLCLQYPNAYCEVAYLEPLLQPAGADQLATRLARELPKKSHSVTGGPEWTFADKVMYGTDWHMLYKEDGRERYLQCCDDIIRRITDGPGRRKFFAGNAVNFLQLGRLVTDPRFTAEQQQYWQKILADAQ